MVAVRGPDKNTAHNDEFGFSSTEKNLSVAELYTETLVILRRKLSLFVWQGFFEPLKPVSLENSTLTIEATTPFHKDWVTDHYLLELADAASSVHGSNIAISIVVCESSSKPIKPAPEALLPPVRKLTPPPVVSIAKPTATAKNLIKTGMDALPSTGLNPAYTFDSFVPGPSNQMAYAASCAIAEEGSSQYSPLFLFGPAGLGKTHLLHAIGIEAQKKRPGTRILYMSSEQWVNAYVQSIRNRNFDTFRRRFRNSCDILLIDDIQFLAGKDASQDEFFHTFNALHQANKQIILTSDKYPHQIAGLEERLQTRLSWGLIADVRPPEMETRIAILHKKAEACGFVLPNDVAHFLASRSTNSVREMEGALLRLSAFTTITRSPITLSLAQEYLTPVFRKSKTQVSPESICQTVAAFYDLKVDELFGKSRIKQVALARQVAIYFCRTLLSISLPELGRFFGGRDHSTILSSLRKIENLITTDIGLQSVINRLESSFAKN